MFIYTDAQMLYYIYCMALHIAIVMCVMCWSTNICIQVLIQRVLARTIVVSIY